MLYVITETFIMFVIFYGLDSLKSSFSSAFNSLPRFLFLQSQKEVSPSPFVFMWRSLYVNNRKNRNFTLKALLAVFFCWLFGFFFSLKSFSLLCPLLSPPIFQWTSSIFYVIFHSLFYIKKTRKRSCSSFFLSPVPPAYLLLLSFIFLLSLFSFIP